MASNTIRNGKFFQSLPSLPILTSLPVGDQPDILDFSVCQRHPGRLALGLLPYIWTSRCSGAADVDVSALVTLPTLDASDADSFSQMDE